MYYRASSIMLNTGQKASNACDIFIAQPDSHKESLAGKLFILIEIESEKSEALKIINFLINNINHNYYQSEKVILRERIESLKIEHIFETALAKSNKDLVDFLSQEKIKISPYAFNITIAIIHEGNIHFSTVGKNKSLLIYQDKINNDNQVSEYKITEVSESKKRKLKQTNITKLFTEVTSGRIPENGYFLLANEALSEYLSNRQLIEIITKLPPAGATTQIKNTLGQINAYVSFLGIIIKNSTTPEKTQEPEEYAEALSSIGSVPDSATGLNTTEQKTEKILSPSGVVNFSEWVKKIKQATSSAVSIISTRTLSKAKITKTSKTKLLPLKDKVFFKKRSSQYSLSKITLLIKKTGLTLINITAYSLKSLYQTLSDKDKMKKIGENIKNSPQNTSGKIKNSKNWLKGLNKKHKIILTITIAIFIFLFANLFMADIKKDNQQKQQNVTKLTNEIKKNQSEIQKNLLYDNEKKAKEILQKNKDLLSQLSNDLQNLKESELQSKYQHIADKHDDQINRLKKATELAGARQITNIKEINTNASPDNLILAPNRLFLGDSSKKTIYKAGINNNVFTAITSTNELINELKYQTVNDNFVYYLNGDNILQLNSNTEELINNNIELPENKNGIVSMSTFNNSIYLLSNTDDQIYKYNKTDNSFVGRIGWIKEEADLSNAVDLSIDGSIYVLFKDGKVNKYMRNKQQEFEIDPIEPNFQEATKIQVSPEWNNGYIYILEPINNRIAVFNKEGDFKMQYQDSGFSDLLDFVVDKENEKIYILNNTQIYEVEAKHLQE